MSTPQQQCKSYSHPASPKSSLDASEADMKARMLHLLKTNTLYTNPYFDKVITWSHDPHSHPRPPIDYQLALINQSRERIEALTIDRELTLRALKSIPHLTDEQIWENINLGLRMLPDHCPYIDDMTGTFVEITMHVRELKALIWRVESVIRGSLEMVEAYGVPRSVGDGGFGVAEEEGVSVDIGGVREPAMPNDMEEPPYRAKKEGVQCNIREEGKDERVTPSEKFIHSPNTATNETGFSTHDTGKVYQVTPAEQEIFVPASTPARERAECPPSTTSMNKKYQEQHNIHKQKEIIKLAAKQAALFTATRIFEGDSGANSDDNKNKDITINKGINTTDDHRSEDKAQAAARDQIMDKAQMALNGQAAEESALFAARVSGVDNIGGEVQAHVIRTGSNGLAGADDETITERDEAFNGGGLMEDAQMVVLRVATEGAAMFSAETMVEDGYENMLVEDMRRAVIDEKVQTDRVRTAPNQAASTAAKATQEAKEKSDWGLINAAQRTVLPLIAEGAAMFAAEEMAEDGYEKTAAEDVQRATIKCAAEEAAGLAALFQAGGGDDEKNPIVDVPVEAETQALLSSSESLPAEETAEEDEEIRDAERCGCGCTMEDQRALIRFAAEEAAAFAVTLIRGAESEEGENASIGVVGAYQGESIHDDQKAVVKRAAEEAAAFAVTLIGQTEGGEREVASTRVQGGGQCGPVVDDQRSIVKHAAQEAAFFAASFVTMRDRETEDTGGSEKGADEHYAEMWKGNGGSWVIIGTESSDGVRDNDYERLCEGLSALGPTSHDENWVDEEMERDNEERMNDGMCVAT